MDILTGDGRLVTATRDGLDAELFRAFPNSYGSLGYAVRLRIELEPVQRYVALSHVRFDALDDAMAAVAAICRERAYDDQPVDFLDGVVFAPDETYLTLGRWTETLSGTGLMRPSDYTGQEIYYRSLRERQRDVLTAYDYLWRWDTDWFWCSRAFGAQHPVARRLWPGRYRRSDVYHRIVGLENRFGVAARWDQWRGRPARERVVQDVEIPVDRTAAFLRWFCREVPMSPVWLCPIQLREPGGAGTATRWPLYPLSPGQLYVNVGFWGTVPIGEAAVDGDTNRAVEQAVADHGGHKSLYSDAYYDERTFDRLYGGETYRKVKQAYDPDQRLTGMYEKVVERG
jgi:FAD/FMN-containing dehydrogenase